ncbi:hypothetical protein [Miniphocaeibacter sp.]|uniref:hypothetical protein n=1 Tax=Miniphocaeibacter sp. TaxID=3100973 RepID=UPI003BB1472B
MINDRFNTVPFIKKLIILLVIVFLFVIYLYGVFFVFQKYKEIKNAFEKIVVLILLLLSTPTLLLLMLNILISIGNIMN